MSGLLGSCSRHCILACSALALLPATTTAMLFSPPPNKLMRGLSSLARSRARDRSVLNGASATRGEEVRKKGRRQRAVQCKRHSNRVPGPARRLLQTAALLRGLVYTNDRSEMKGGRSCCFLLGFSLVIGVLEVNWTPVLFGRRLSRWLSTVLILSGSVKRGLITVGVDKGND